MFRPVFLGTLNDQGNFKLFQGFNQSLVPASFLFAPGDSELVQVRECHFLGLFLFMDNSFLQVLIIPGQADYFFLDIVPDFHSF